MSIKEDTLKAAANCYLCWEYRTDSVKAKEFAKEGLRLSEKLKFEKTKALCLDNLGDTYLVNSQYERAISFYSKALEIRKKEGNLKSVASLLNMIGLSYSKLSKYDQALDYLLESRKIYEKLNDNINLFYLMTNIAEMYYIDNNFDKAIKIFEESLIVAKKTADDRAIASAYTNLALGYTEIANYDKALKYYQYGLEHDLKSNNEEGLVVDYLNMGLLYYYQKNYKKAEEFYLNCIKIVTKRNDERTKCIAYNNLGEVYIEQIKYLKAINYCEKSYILALKINQKDLVLDASVDLSKAYSGLKNHKKAFEFQRLSSQLKDTLYNTERAETVAEMQTKYDVEKKEKENQLLNQQIKLQEIDAKQQRTISTSIGLSAILLLILAYFIYRGNSQKQKINVFLESRNNEILKQKETIEIKNKEIVDSINYAQLIQQAVLPGAEELTSQLKDGFVLFKPKDIVSGDFYWVSTIDDHTFFTTVDCTGHGVPGGFMSMLGSSLLNEVINEKKILEPADVLDMMRIKLITSLKQKGSSGENKDGMDMTLCRLNESRTELVYAAANNPLWLIRDEKLIEYPADKQPVGISTDNAKQFKQQKISLQKGDSIYIFTDGYADQFGGPKGKKFKYKPLQHLLLKNSHKSMNDQKEILKSSIEEWKGNLEQVDDILIIGIKI